jgi:hypothetical protein
MRLFGEKKKDPKELLRENQRTLKKSEREMDRESLAMKREEQKLILEIKKASKVIFRPAACQSFAWTYFLTF